MTAIDYSLVDSFLLYYHRRDLRRALHGLSSMADSHNAPITFLALPDGDHILLPFSLEDNPPDAASKFMRWGGRLVLPLFTHINQPDRFVAIPFKIIVHLEGCIVEVRCIVDYSHPRDGIDFQRGFLELLDASWGIFGAIEYDLHAPPTCYLDDPAQIVLMDGWLFPGLRSAASFVKARLYTLRHRGQAHAAFYRDWVQPFLPFFTRHSRPYYHDSFIHLWTEEEQTAFMQLYETKLPFITPAILRQLLFDLDMEYQKIGACLIGLGKWTELTPDVGEQLLRYPWRFPFCFVLACFNHEQAAEYFQQFLNKYLAVPHSDERLRGAANPYNEVMAALLRYDASHATHHAAQYLQPDGLWTRYEAYHHVNRPRFSADDDPPFIPRSAIDWMELGQALTPSLKFASRYLGSA